MAAELTLAQIARLVDGELKGDAERRIRGPAGFAEAKEDQITFAAGAKYLNNLSATRAGAVLLPRDSPPSERTRIEVDHPQLAFITLIHHWYPVPKPVAGIHSSAVVAETALVGQETCIGPQTVIAENVRLGDRVQIQGQVHIGEGVTVGDDTIIHPQVTLYPGCRIGSRVIIHAGTVIGSDGFGFVPHEGRYHKIPHLGVVQIDDDVEIGANNTIDRATLGRTWIQEGVKTDNLVHIAHNVTVGAHTVLVAQVGVSGSTRIGKHAVLAGQAGVSGHVTIGDRVTIGPQAGIARSVAEGQTVSGSPEMPHATWLRVQRLLPQLPELNKRVRKLEKRLAQLNPSHSDP
ncbi:MAG: UDP-3-O-(3-hydroxymyristoyl)glucosamine N-acyltransferase [Desulfobacterales bacterium]|jgi:UDP-3-O-[3-hydroxymyristoyl] glucosamine N-acyltransferase